MNDLQRFADKIFFGGNIYTMANNNQNPIEAVAILNDRIIFSGTKDEAFNKYKNEKTELFDLRGDILLPGFIDPHIHHAFAGAFYYLVNIRADEDWGLPGVKSNTARNREDFLKKLKEVESELKDPNEWLIVMGYASYFHGKMIKSDLEEISSTRPILLLQRSGHEAILNSKALLELKYTEENTKNDNQIDFSNGRFVEAAVIEKMIPLILPILLKGNNWETALKKSVEYLHKNGITTVADMMAIDGFDENQKKIFREIIDAPDVSLRTYMIAEPRLVYEKMGEDAAIKFIDSLPKKNGNNLTYLKQVKMFVDGAFFAQLMRIKSGYTDGHQGEWITPVSLLKKIATTFWTRSYSIHVHVNGDEGLEAILGIFDELKKTYPQSTSRVTFHHIGYSQPEQIQKMKELNISASLLPYYLHALGDIYAKVGFSSKNAHRIGASGTCLKNKIRISLHSDFPMAPSNPLYLAWCAVNRIGVLSDTVLCPEERIGVYFAMKAITIDAAYTFGLEKEIGSIEIGKKADFTILADDPFKIDPIGLKDIKITGKVFNGKYYKINN